MHVFWAIEKFVQVNVMLNSVRDLKIHAVEGHYNIAGVSVSKVLICQKKMQKTCILSTHSTKNVQ